MCVIVSFQLGAGTSLPGLVAAKVGADVTLTDDANKLEVFTSHCSFVIPKVLSHIVNSMRLLSYFSKFLNTVRNQMLDS